MLLDSYGVDSHLIISTSRYESTSQIYRVNYCSFLNESKKVIKNSRKLSRYLTKPFPRRNTSYYTNAITQ
jgi:hypothetical protein